MIGRLLTRRQIAKKESTLNSDCGRIARHIILVDVAMPDGDLNDMRLEFYEALPAMDPLLIDLHGAVPETRHIANAVDTLVALLRSRTTVKSQLSMARSKEDL
jgi:hypothetical protein